MVLIKRQRAVRRVYLDREIAIHRQEFEAEEPIHDESEDAEGGSATEAAVAENTSIAKKMEGTQEVPVGNGDDVEMPGTDDDSFAVALVRLMRSCVEIWEQTSGQTRIELAENSRAWQVTVDSGRLRTRTMDRYCDIKKLPKVPRWRQVVRTCRYILINCELSEGQRQRLNDELERVFAIQRSRALMEQN